MQRAPLTKRVESFVVSAREEEPFREVEVAGRRILKRVPPQKMYTTCTVNVSERVDEVLLFAVCRPGPPHAEWSKAYRPLTIPHVDFVTCDPNVYVEKYKLGRKISEKLAEVCRALKARYGPRLARAR